ncbi:phosphotransferase enzyme family protein [Agromyces sp. Marseille-Q5079]|uniref:phosphotransferase enzyme family protein n=1 Tax=Agromyces sp. Marseille-Q5079 TaxID=3439059 RepID=UPI003D9C7E82
MLWETVDSADAALSTRFGFSDAGHAVAWLEEALREEWDVRVDSCDRLVISASNLLAWLTADGRRLVAKVCAEASLFRHLANVDAVIAWLQDEGIPVAAPLIAIDGRVRVDRGGYSVSVYPFVGGSLLDVEDAGQVDAAGRMLASLHGALASYPGPFGDRLPPDGQQLVHGDFRSANILQVDGAITAILDFDDASYGSRAEELARSAVLLGTRYHDWQPISRATREVFVSAYNEVAPLTSAERYEFDQVVVAVSKDFGWT